MTTTVFPHIRPAGINFLLGLQMRVLLEITRIHLHKSVSTAGIIRVAGIIRGRALYKEIRYVPFGPLGFKILPISGLLQNLLLPLYFRGNVS